MIVFLILLFFFIAGMLLPNYLDYIDEDYEFLLILNNVICRKKIITPFFVFITKITVYLGKY